MRKLSASRRRSMGSRVVVRELMLGDFENWRQAYSLLGAPQNEWDEGGWRESELTRPKFRALLKEQSKMRKLDQQYSYGIFDADDGMLVGFIYLMDVRRGIFQSAFIGYRIFNPYWGRGFATAAIQHTLKTAFTRLKLHRVEAGISPANKASIKVAKRTGFRKEGLSRRRLLIQGKWVDLLIYAVTCEDMSLKYLK